MFLTAALTLLPLLQGTLPTDSIIRLPLRVHLLRSQKSPALTTTVTDSAVRMYLTIANDIWQQAGIQWQLDSIMHEDAPNGAVFERVIKRDTLVPLSEFMPRAQLLEPGWNLFLIQDFGQVGGGAFRPEVKGVILAQRGFGFELPADGRGGATLAHELGHSLGLKHEVCDSTRNIMANGCWQPTTRSTLSSTQILTAREQARTRGPGSTIP